MKKLLATVLMLGLAQGAMAADDVKAPVEGKGSKEVAGDVKGHEGKGPRHHGGGEKMFAKIDTDNDGFISKKEADAFHEEQFAKQDANKDGKLSKDEMKAFHKERMEKFRKEHPGKGPKDEAPKDAPKDAPEAE